jgi:hypothetical protein
VKEFDVGLCSHELERRFGELAARALEFGQRWHPTRSEASAFVFIPAFVANRSLGMKTQTPRGRLFALEALLLKTGSVVEPTLKLL